MKNQKKNILILLIVISIILYICLKGDFINVINEIKKANVLWLLISIIYVMLYIFTRAVSLNIISKKFNKEYSLLKTFKIVLSTSFFDSITPFSSGGQPAQIYMLNKDGFKISDSTNIVIQNSIVYQIALVLFGLVAIIINSKLKILADNSLLKILIIIGFGVNLLVIVLLIFFSFSKKVNSKVLNFIIRILGKLKIIKNKEEKIKSINDNIDRFVNNSKELFSNYKLLIIEVLICFISFIFLYIIPIFISYSLGEYNKLNLITTLVTSSYVMMIGTFIPIPGGSGGIEYGFMKFFGNFIYGSTLKAAMLLWRFVTYYYIIIASGISLCFRKRRIDKK